MQMECCQVPTGKCLCDHQCVVTNGRRGSEEEEHDCYMIIMVSNKPKDDTVIFISSLCSPPRGWSGLARDGEVVPHRDGEVGALAPLAGLSLGPGWPATWAGAHWQPDPLPGPAQGVGGGARHPTVRAGPRHLPHITGNGGKYSNFSLHLHYLLTLTNFLFSLFTVQYLTVHLIYYFSSTTGNTPNTLNN